MTRTTLLSKIEECRKEMLLLSKQHDLSSDIVISSSRKLDKLINDYLKYCSVP